MHNSSYRKQQGIALISVMLVVAMTVIIATNMSGRLQRGMQRTQNFIQQKQAYWYALGAETFAQQLLKRTIKDSKDKIFHAEQDWAIKGMNFPVDNGVIGGDIHDMRACFNLNALANKFEADPQKPNIRRSLETRQFQRLLELANIEAADEPEVLADRLYDWLDADNFRVSSQSYEEDDYASLDIPYLSANTLMASITELRLVGGFTPNVIDKIKPYICVIPGNQQLLININTLDSENSLVMAALIDNFDQGKAQEVLTDRPESGYKNADELWGLPDFQGIEGLTDTVKQQFVVTSKFFILKGRASFAEQKFFLNSTIYLKSESEAIVIRRQFGSEV